MNVSGVRLLIFCLFGLMPSGYGDGLLQHVIDLEQGVEAQTTVYYNLIGSSLLDGLMQRPVPSILIREETDMELRKHFNSKILSIVFIGTEFDDRVFSTLRKNLHRLHRTDVLFVTETLGAEENWTWLFEWCWTHGLSNVLLSSSQQPQLLALYRLHSQHIRTTTLSEYFERRNKWHDLHGHEVRLLVGHDPPYGIVYEKNVTNQDAVIGGNYYQMVKLFAAHHNASLVIIRAPNNKSFSTFDCIEYFEAKQADFCSAIGIYDERLRYAVAAVYRVSPIRLMIPCAKRLATYQYFILPFAKVVWVALLLEICCVAMATSFFYWRSYGSFDLSGSLLQAFKGMLYLGFTMGKLAGKAKLLIYLIVLCSGFIFTNLYLAKMSSILTSHVYEKEIDTQEELGARGVNILVNSIVEKYIDIFDSTKTQKRISKVIDDDSYRSYIYDLNPKYAYLCPMERCMFYMHQQKGMSRPNLRLMSEVLRFSGNSIPIAHECPFEEAFNEFLLRAFAAGLYEEVSWRTNEDAIREGILKSFRTEEDNQPKPLTLKDLQVLPLILAIGYSAALVSFCMEKLIFYVTSRKSRVKAHNLKKMLRK